MEPAYRTDSESVAAKGEGLKSVAPSTREEPVRGQFRGYRQEPGVAPDSSVERSRRQAASTPGGGVGALYSRWQITPGVMEIQIYASRPRCLNITLWTRTAFGFRISPTS
jgi:hypothetical protein